VLARLKFLLNRTAERLWVRPLAMCVVSIAGAFLAKAADRTSLADFIPAITSESIETLLTIMASSMLVIATFAVASMVSAYASASATATPRTFSLVVADDVSQNALSTFIGAFFFSLVSLIAVLNGFYGQAGRFALFVLTSMAFSAVIVTFVRWVDRIARLGRLGSVIDKVEAVTAKALCGRRDAPTLCAAPSAGPPYAGLAVHPPAVGYVQRVDIHLLQTSAEAIGARVAVVSLPGTFAAPDTVLARVVAESGDASAIDTEAIARAFLIGDARVFDDDPRFGLVVLSEIASRALSPAVNDPGTAIDVIGTLVRLFALWSEPVERPAPEYDRVEVPEIVARDMFDDAFTGIARDGAAAVEVAGRLQKAFASLAVMSGGVLAEAARHHSRLALARAEQALTLPEDRDEIRRLAARV
jgi:uncharacterized membrane protein